MVPQVPTVPVHLGTVIGGGGAVYSVVSTYSAAWSAAQSTPRCESWDFRMSRRRRSWSVHARGDRGGENDRSIGGLWLTVALIAICTRGRRALVVLAK